MADASDERGQRASAASTSASTGTITRPISLSRKKQQRQHPSHNDLAGRHRLQAGQHVLLELPSTGVKRVTLGDGECSSSSNATVSLGKFGHFRLDALLGRPYGETYDMAHDGRLAKVFEARGQLATVEDEGEGDDDDDDDDLQGRGDVIGADTSAQTLSLDELEQLKAAGVRPDEILDRLVQSHLAFDLKNGYSKEKYLRKKEAKYRRRFTVLEPTVENISAYLLERERTRVRELAPQSLGYMTAVANVRPGGRTLVVDDAHGILTAAVLHRQAGQGLVLALHDNDVPSHESIDLFNFDSSQLATYRPLAWNVTQEDWLPTGYLVNGMTTTVNGAVTTGKRKRKKTAGDKIYESRFHLFDGEFESCLISTHFDLEEVVNQLTPFLTGSAALAVHSAHIEPLSRLSETLRHSRDFINVQINEVFLREYQVLPGRCHPLMSMSGGGGYILSAIRVIPDETAYLSASQSRRERFGTQKPATASTAADAAVLASSSGASTAPVVGII